MEDRRDFLKKLGFGSVALLTTTAGVTYAKENVFADSCVCEKCGYDFRLRKDEIKAEFRSPPITMSDMVEVSREVVDGRAKIQYEAPTGVFRGVGTMCPQCGNWAVYKEFTCCSC
jgi:hypothetical protein